MDGALVVVPFSIRTEGPHVDDEITGTAGVKYEGVGHLGLRKCGCISDIAIGREEVHVLGRG